jgi:hypothetical protein
MSVRRLRNGDSWNARVQKIACYTANVAYVLHIMFEPINFLAANARLQNRGIACARPVYLRRKGN